MHPGKSLMPQEFAEPGKPKKTSREFEARITSGESPAIAGLDVPGKLRREGAGGYAAPVLPGDRHWLEHGKGGSIFSSPLCRCISVSPREAIVPTVAF